MKLKDLVDRWEDEAHGSYSQDVYSVKLSLEDSARIDALSDMYPRRSKEQIISELLAASLAELESSFPYVESTRIASRDEHDDPVFADEGPTPTFLSLTKKHLLKRKNAEGT